MKTISKLCPNKIIGAGPAIRPSSTPLVQFLAAALVLTITGNVLATVRYVDQNSTNAIPPYTNWTTAATNIQDAVDAAVAGDEVVVTNGLYATGGRAVYGTMTNRVAVDKPLTLRSVNGPQVTIIQGHFTTSSDGAIRCVYLTNGASLSGFTLTNGATRPVNDSPRYRESSGGGLFCESTSAVISNCILTGNSASIYGGGSYGCTLNNCTLSNNQAHNINDAFVSGGGAYGATLNNCALSNNGAYTLTALLTNGASGGGAAYCTLNNCTLAGNALDGYNTFGGGAYNCTLNNCVLTGNYAIDGGGAGLSTLYNCTIVYNLAADVYNGPGYAGGAAYSTLYNCIVFYNDVGVYVVDYRESSLYNCWTTNPLFTGDLRLQSNSPCINAGNNAYAPVGPDLDGNPRIVGGTVDIGAYEYQSLSLINFAVVSNQAGFSMTGQSNQVVIVETSADLANWSPLATNTLSGHPFSFSDPAPANLPRRFYRAQPR